MRKALFALAALLTAGVAHAESPLSLHGITLGRDLPPSCNVSTFTPCVLESNRTYGGLRMYTVGGLAPVGSVVGEDATEAKVAVDAHGKIRAVATLLGPTMEEFERAHENLVLRYGNPTVDGGFFGEWDFQDSTLEVYSPEHDVNAVFVFDDAVAGDALDMLHDLYPNAMEGL